MVKLWGPVPVPDAFFGCSVQRREEVSDDLFRIQYCGLRCISIGRIVSHSTRLYGKLSSFSTKINRKQTRKKKREKKSVFGIQDLLRVDSAAYVQS